VTLFVHGFLGSVDDWAATLTKVSGRAIPIPRSSSIEEAADALVPTTPCLIVGYSLGGRLAMLAAARNPGAFTGVIAVSADPGNAGADRTALDAQRADHIEESGLGAFVDGWYQAELWASLRSHRAFDPMVERRRSTSPEDAAWALRTYSAGLQPDLWDSLPKDLTVVVGEKDPKYLALGRRMAACGIPLHIVPGVGHAIPTEAPAVLAGIVRSVGLEASIGGQPERSLHL
jgi:2-succinyl-6-hydroxy-2,4-cyclohexadiene-1-carboxylate synthase